jgi:hypothetical protein|tara:strand:+ start:600 stop:2351 length:1752 start_codon:yes stop_codon:yes gene_type:complete
MKTLRLLSRDIFYKSLIILIVFLSSVVAEDEPIDIWKIEKKDNTIEANNEIEDDTKNQTSIIINNSSNQDTQIISNTSLDEKDLIVGLYDPSDNGLKLEMWTKSDGNEIKNIINKINLLELSEDAQKILEITLLTNSQIPNKNITEDEFVNFKIDYLIKKNNKKLIKDYLEKNKSNIYNLKLIKHYVDDYLIGNEIKKSCELLNNIDILNDDYLSKFKIYCLLIDNEREQAQLIYDLLIERGFNDKIFEDKFFFLMNYKSDVKKEISENTILDFHLSYKVDTDFNFQPQKETPQFIWKYLSNANLLQNTELINIEDYEQISLIEQATHEGIYNEDELFKLYKRFQFNINQLLNAKDFYKDLPLSEGRALIYQKLLLSNDPEKILEYSQLLKNSFNNDNLENAFNLELKKFLEKIDILDVPSDYSTFYSKNMQKEELIKKNIKINNKIIHQSKLLNYLNGKKSIKDIDKDLINILKSVRKNKKYIVTTKDLVLMEALISDGLEIPKKYQNLFEFGKSNIPTDIQLLISNDEIGLVLLRLVEIIGQDNIELLDPDTLYFISTILNTLDIDQIRNDILLKVLPLKV